MAPKEPIVYEARGQRHGPLLGPGYASGGVRVPARMQDTGWAR